MSFVVVLTLLVSAVSGLWPALRVTRHDLRNTLHAGRGFAFGGFGKVGAALLVVEIALSVALLNGAVTMARSFQAMLEDVPALPKGQVLTAHLGRIDSPEMRDQIVEAAAAHAGRGRGGRRGAAAEAVSAAAADDDRSRSATSRPRRRGWRRRSRWASAISKRSARAPLAGRLFAAADFLDGAAPVAVVNEPFVQKFLGGRNPIGRRIRIDAARDRPDRAALARDRRRGSGSRPERRRSGAGRRLLHAGARRAPVSTSRSAPPAIRRRWPRRCAPRWRTSIPICSLKRSCRSRTPAARIARS